MKRSRNCGMKVNANLKSDPFLQEKYSHSNDYPSSNVAQNIFGTS